MIETVLKDFSNAYDLTFASLRYFNAPGSSEGLGYTLEPRVT